MDNILEVVNVVKNYDKFKLDNVSFNLKKGCIMGLIGENGSGKTTTIKLIMNLASKDKGKINIFGKDNVKYNKDIKEKIGFVYDECFYYDNFSMKKNAKMISAFYKNWDSNLFNNYLKRFNLNGNEKVKNLSKGMKMKFAIALALSHRAKFIIMDEPTAGLDPIMREDFLELLREIMQDEDISILFSTHITSDLERVADYVTYIKSGRVEFSEPIVDILEEYRIVKGDKELINNENRKEFISLDVTEYGFQGLTKEIKKIEKIFGKKVILEKPSLEDIMIFKNKEI